MTALLRRPLRCVEMVELMTAYLEDALSYRDRRRFEAHIDDCTNCGEYLAQFRRTIELTGRADPGALAGPAIAELLAAFRDWGGDGGPASSTRPGRT